MVNQKHRICILAWLALQIVAPSGVDAAWPMPAPPIAQNDSVTTPEDTPVLIDVLANDSDPNGDLLTVIEAEAFLGEVTIEADGRLRYVPAPDFSGTETFSYVIRNASGFEAGAEVEVTVIPVNDPPIAEITPPLALSGPAPLTLRFQATSSIDLDGEIVDWHWDFGDGQSTQGEDVQHTFLLAGRHTVELTVTDNQGATGTATLEIEVAGLYRTLFVVAPDPATGGLRAGDQAVADRLAASGVQVDTRAAVGVSTADATGYDLVLLSSTPSSSQIGSKFRDVPIPVATWESHILDDMGMTEGTAQLDFGPAVDQTTLFLEPDNLLAPDLSGSLTVASEPVTMTFGRAGRLALGAARNPQRFERLHLFGYEAGDPMVGLDAPERRLSLFLSDTTATSLTEEGWALFDSAICWVVNCSGDALARFTFEAVEGEPLTVVFDGSLSRPGRDQGQIATLLEWSWRTGDTTFTGGPEDAQQWTVAFDEAGLYEIELTVTDSEGRNHALVRQIQVGPTAYRALFGVGSLGLGAGDRVVVDLLEHLDFAVDIVGYREVEMADAADVDLVLVSSTVDSTLMGADLRHLAKPVLTWERNLFDDLALTGSVNHLDYGQDQDVSQVQVVAASHPAIAPLSGLIDLYLQADTLHWGVPDAAATVLATTSSDPSRAAIFVYETGDSMVGITAPARRAALPYSDLGPWLLTGDGWHQLAALIRWAVAP